MVPPAGHNADGPAPDQRFPAGRLVIDGGFVVPEPGGGR